jgi:hypothetical protein
MNRLSDVETGRTFMAVTGRYRVVAPPLGCEQPEKIRIDLRSFFPSEEQMDDGLHLPREARINGADVFWGAVVLVVF